MSLGWRGDTVVYLLSAELSPDSGGATSEASDISSMNETDQRPADDDPTGRVNGVGFNPATRCRGG